MRTGFALILAVVLGGCGADGAGIIDDDTSTPDSSIPEEPALRIQSPEIDIQPGQEITYCWYFRTSNTKPLAIKRWESSMSPGSHHLIMYATTNDVQPPGTVSTINCGAGAGLASFPTWMYSAQDPQADLVLPADDGEGKPLAMELAANQAGFIQMHYNNRSDAVIKAQVTVSAYALDEGAAYTRTAAYVTYNGNIKIPMLSKGHVEAMTCDVPTTSKFWMVTTHAHKQAVRTTVRDGESSIGGIAFESRNWEHPGAARWDGPFRTFGTGKLSYECEYNNPWTFDIEDGPSAVTDEMCMASGYFFPATRPVFCFNSTTF